MQAQDNLVRKQDGPIIAGDGVGKEDVNPFHATPSPGLIAWMASQKVSLGFTTYGVGKLVLIGPGRHGGIALSERSFGRAMALRATESSLYLSTQHQVWLFRNGLDTGVVFEGWDRLYMPRSCHVTGGVDVHDIHVDAQGRLLVAVTAYNCLAELDERGSFSPIWRPSFIDTIVAEDRCHFNGFCLDDGEPAYATVVGPSNIAGGWRDMRADGGLVIDIRTDQVILDGLSMPHTPRLYRGELYVLEAGSGWFGLVDRYSAKFERLCWCPGFLRGLSFHDDYAVVALSKPRNEVFSGLPLGDELAKRGVEPECAAYIIRLSDGSVRFKLNITGSVEEIYDTTFLEDTLQPLLIGIEKIEVAKYVAIGPDLSGRAKR